MSEHDELLLYLALWLAPTGLVLLFLRWLIREEARKTRAHIDDVAASLRSSFESLEGAFATLSRKKFGLFKTRLSRKEMQETDWHWTVMQIDKEASDKGDLG